METTVAGTGASEVVRPPVDGQVDYQLGGDYPPPDGTTIVTRDVTGAALAGVYSICYVNGFQTQPGDTTTFPPDVVTDLEDPGWPGEHLIDLSTATKRARAAQALTGQLDECASKGFQAVELDNLDSWTRFDDAPAHVDVPFGEAEAVDYATRLVTMIHRRGMAAGQKNTSQLGSLGPDRIGFDFAVSEECGRYDECDAYTSLYGDHVIDIEYDDESFAVACAAIGNRVSVVRRDVELSTPSSAAYAYDTC